MKVTAQELANLNKILTDLWNRNVTPETHATWRTQYGAEILDAHLTVKTMLALMPKLDVDLVTEL